MQVSIEVRAMWHLVDGRVMLTVSVPEDVHDALDARQREDCTRAIRCECIEPTREGGRLAHFEHASTNDYEELARQKAAAP